MSESYQQRSFPLGEFIAMIVALVIIFLVMAMGAGAGGGSVTVLSHNRVLSPDTTIIVNSNNTSASNNGPVISGDRSTVVTSGGETLCADPANPGQYNAPSCGGSK